MGVKIICARVCIPNKSRYHAEVWYDSVGNESANSTSAKWGCSGYKINFI